jgi:hypothetical protein
VPLPVTVGVSTAELPVQIVAELTDTVGVDVINWFTVAVVEQPLAVVTVSE